MMTRLEATQATADLVGIIEGADLPEAAPEAMCEECGALVKLDSEITVTITEMDGSEVYTTVTEAEARALLCQVGLQPPPVLCDKHERVEIEMVRDA